MRVSVVSAEDLSVRYGSIHAVSDVTFDVGAGEVVALVGANGAGKTSTIGALVGVLRPSTGRIRVFGADPWIERATLSRRWGVMPQAGGLPMGLTVGECARLFADLYRRGSAVGGVLEQCGLTGVSGRRWRSLSMGQQQRLSLAIALLGGDDLLVLDEPTAALDVEGQQRVLDIIAQRASGGTAALVTSHRLDEVERLADRVIVLHEGRLRADTSVTALTRAVPEVRIEGVPDDRLAELSAAVGVSFAAGAGEAVGRIPEGGNPHELLRSVLDWCAAKEIIATSASVGRRSLADAYRELLAE